MKRIVFRADAKPSLGIGDLVSLVNLSKYFERADWEVHFIVKRNNAAIGLIKKHKVKNYLVLENDIPISQEIEKINKYTEKSKIDVIMLEITERKLTEYTGLSEKMIKTCVNFDGVIQPGFKLVIDWDIGASSRFDIDKYPDTKFLLGPKYTVLPIDFDFKKINNRVYKPRPEVLLIAMGGADEFNFAQKVADTFINNNTDLNLRIVVGSGYQYLEGLKSRLAQSNVEYTIRENIDNMFDEFMNADAAVAAGGLTSFELIASRTPSFIIATYGHQIPRCAYFDKAGWATYLGFRNFNESVLLDGLNNPARVPPMNIFRTDNIREVVDELIEKR